MELFSFNDTATTQIYTFLHTLSLHDALPISAGRTMGLSAGRPYRASIGTTTSAATALYQPGCTARTPAPRSEEHTSELQSLMRISYADFCLKKKNSG